APCRGHATSPRRRSKSVGEGPVRGPATAGDRVGTAESASGSAFPTRGFTCAAGVRRILAAELTAGDYLQDDQTLILLAEDSPSVQAMVSFRLERSGYDVLVTDNGDDALRLARERLPALAVLDVEMPGLSGLEVTRRLRAEDQTRDMPVILLTSLDGELAVAEGYEAGANDYVTKPFSPQELQTRVKGLLGT
ncbi:MAG TPA: response regulator, partial [Actinomycetota bacterium]|nr:response regulator [Actinomycetota bacterium]